MEGHLLHLTASTMERAHQTIFAINELDYDYTRLFIGGRRLKVLAHFVNSVAQECNANWGLQFWHDSDFTCLYLEVRRLGVDLSSDGSSPLSLYFPHSSIAELFDDGLPPMRVAADMQAYSYAEFEEYYGEHASRMWQLASPLDTDS